MLEISKGWGLPRLEGESGLGDEATGSPGPVGGSARHRVGRHSPLDSPPWTSARCPSKSARARRAGSLWSALVVTHGWAGAGAWRAAVWRFPLGRARAILASQSVGWFHERAVFEALQELAGCLVDGEASARNRELEDL